MGIPVCADRCHLYQPGPVTVPSPSYCLPTRPTGDRLKLVETEVGTDRCRQSDRDLKFLARCQAPLFKEGTGEFTYDRLGRKRVARADL